MLASGFVFLAFLPLAFAPKILFIAGFLFLHVFVRRDRAEPSNEGDWKLDSNCLPEAILLTDMNGKLISANNVARSLFPDCETAETINKLFDVWHNELNDRGPADDVIAAALAAPDFQFSETLHLNDGRAFERYTRIEPSQSRRVWILRDISHQQHAHRDSEMHTTMVEADAARTAELAEQLYHAKAELEAKQAELTRLANTDSLTGLLIRRRFTALGEQAIRETKTKNICVIMMDIDHFKRINDTYGHAAGDVAIRNFSNIAENEVGEHGFIGRMGGEEFAVILADFEMSHAIKIAESIRKATSLHTTLHDTEKFRFTVSIGVAQWIPGEITIEAALDRSDRALYSAKTYGRNRVVGYETD